MSCNDTVQFVIATLLPTADSIEEPPVGRFVPHEFLKMRKGCALREYVGGLLIQPAAVAELAVDHLPATTANHTQVLDHLLQSGLAFHSSKAGKKWGNRGKPRHSPATSRRARVASECM